MFGLDRDPDDGRGLEVEWRKGRAGGRRGDGGRLENEFLHSSNTWNKQNIIQKSLVSDISKFVLKLRAVSFNKVP